jgi:hypothetical protein
VTYAGPVHLILASRILADDSNGPGAGLGLIVFLVLLVGCIFLFRSMAGRINRLPTTFEPPAGDPSVLAADNDDEPVQ